MQEHKAGSNGSQGDPSIEQLRTQVCGELLQPSDASYDQARQIYNGMIDKRPDLILRCGGVSDVIAGVNHARQQGFPLAVRSGGHNVAGNGLSQGGLTLDMTRMNHIRVDPSALRVRAEAGALWRDLDRETHVFGLATTGGVVSSTGIAGLTLGGGIGWLMRNYGLASDNLTSVDIVTADGQLRVASEEENPDLFWAVRGGGGNFGVVTSMEFQLHPVSMVLGGMIAHPLPAAAEVLPFYRDFCETAPDELAVFSGLLHSPDGHPIVGILIGYSGEDLEEGARLVAPLREFGSPVVNEVGPMPYPVLQQMIDEAFPHGMQNYWKSSFITELSDGLIDAIIERYSSAPHPLSGLVFEQMGGAVGRKPTDATAFADREAPFNLLVMGIWEDASQNEQNIEWVRDAWRDVQPWSAGTVYVNYLGPEDEERARLHEAYRDGKLERLMQIKAQYDPENLFHVNQNIQPVAAT